MSAVQFVDTLDVLVSIPLARWTSLALTWTSLVHGSFLSQNRFFLTEWCTQVGLFSYVGDVGHIPSTVFLEKKNHQFLLQHVSMKKRKPNMSRNLNEAAVFCLNELKCFTQFTSSMALNSVFDVGQLAY